MKQLFAITVLSLSLLGLAAMAVGQDQPAQEQPRADTAQSISGVIKALDAKTNMVTITTTDQKEVNFIIDEKTTVSKGGKPASASELKEGQQVKAEVENSRAVSISISI